MNLVAHPSDLSGRIEATGSKSHMQRLLAAGLLAQGESWISAPPMPRTAMAAAEVAAGLGADIEIGQNALQIRGGLAPRTDRPPHGRKRLGMRLFSPIAALAPPLDLGGERHLATPPHAAYGRCAGPHWVPRVELRTRLPPHQLQGPLRGGQSPSTAAHPVNS